MREDYVKNVDFLDEPFSLLELSKAINSLKSDKAAGVDFIVNEIIVNSSTHVKLLLLTIFNVLLQMQYFPDYWTIGTMSPIFKKGDKSEVNNKRH